MTGTMKNSIKPGGSRSLRAAGFLMVILLLPLMALPLRHLIFLSQSGVIRSIESDNSRLEKMVFTAEAFSRLNFTRSQHEFMYRGNMYDVHSITKSGSQVTILALWDSAESLMLYAFQNQYNNDGTACPGAIRIGFLPYFQVDPFRPGFRDSIMKQADCLIIASCYSDPFIRISSPPPELLTSF
jgi:hypothetical protein